MRGRHRKLFSGGGIRYMVELLRRRRYSHWNLLCVVLERVGDVKFIKNENKKIK